MTTSMRVEETLWRDGAEHLRHQIADVSLMHGWVPPTVQALALVLLVCAIGWRSRRWWMLRVPFATGLGVGLAMWLHWYITAVGLAGKPARPVQPCLLRPVRQALGSEAQADRLGRH